MAIPENIAAALADKPEVLDFVKGLDVKAEKWTPEIEAVLPEIPKLSEYKTNAAALARILAETKATDPEKLLIDFKNITAVKDDLLRQKSEWKAGGKGVDSPEYKGLEEKIAEMQAAADARIKALEEEGRTNKETAAKATVAQRETELKSTILTAAAKHGIKAPEDEFLLLQAKGQIGYKEVDGKHVPFFYKINEQGQKVNAESADALLKHIAETQKYKVSASGNTGTGQDHRGGAGGGEAPKTAADARRAFMSRSA